MPLLRLPSAPVLPCLAFKSMPRGCARGDLHFMSIQIRCPRAALLFFFFPAIPALADEPPTVPLEPVTVTATRTEQNVGPALASTTVIDRAEIDRRQFQSLPQLLQGVPGLAIDSYGGLGKNASLFLRGAESDHLLVLIDGVRAGSPTVGLTAFQDLPTDQIERIEIVRGPRSSLYGSEAIGGVIQIFTRKSGKDGSIKPTLAVGAGSHSSYKVNGGVSGGTDKYWYSVNGTRLETAGFNSCSGQPFGATGGGGGCFAIEPDHDGYRNTSGSAQLGYRFDNGAEVEGNLLHAEGNNQFDGTLQNRSTFVQQVIGGKLKFAPLDNWNITLRAGRSVDDSDNFLNKDFYSTFNTQRVSASWQNDIRLAEGHLLTVGFDYYNDEISSTTDYAITSRDDKAGFAQYQFGLGGFEAVLAARYDENEQFGGHPTGSVALGYEFENDIRLSASWGTAFKAPSFNELYYPDYGDPHLAPEVSDTWEVGVSGKQLGINWAVNGYHTEVEQLITSVFSTSLCGPPYYYCAQNVDSARILGLEAQASTRLWDFDIAANLTLMDPQNTSDNANYGNVLARRPKNMFRLDVDRNLGPVRAGATVYGQGHSYDDAANQTDLAGFVTLALRASVDVYKGLTLEGRIANLLDKHYETARFYNQDGRNFFITLRYTPDGL